MHTHGNSFIMDRLHDAAVGEQTSRYVFPNHLSNQLCSMGCVACNITWQNCEGLDASRHVEILADNSMEHSHKGGCRQLDADVMQMTQHGNMTSSLVVKHCYGVYGQGRIATHVQQQ